ncbi:MAG: glycosyltransferase, partial [Synergistaceae bacterium]|nr:glycosyltransferase [Synergistaceae bacterium]
MKILHYVDEANLAWGRPWMQLILTLEKNGFANTVLCPPGGILSGFLKEHSVPAIYANAPLPWLPPLCHEVGWAIKRAAPDIIHTRLSSAAKIGGYWGKKLAVPVISTIDKYPKLKYYKNTNVAVGCSSAVTSHMIEAGFPEEQTVTIHNPVDGDFYRFNQDERESFRARAGVGPEETVLLGLGRFIDWKAFDLLIKACSSIKHLPDWRLWLVGDGPDRQKLESMADRLGLRDKATFWGFATDIRPFLWASDLFIQPSNKPEGFSLAILEAMAAGLPAAATTIGGTLDLLD